MTGKQEDLAAIVGVDAALAWVPERDEELLADFERECG